MAQTDVEFYWARGPRQTRKHIVSLWKKDHINAVCGTYARFWWGLAPDLAKLKPCRRCLAKVESGLVRAPGDA